MAKRNKDDGPLVNPRHESMCCLGCGRETRSVYGYCLQCAAPGRGGAGMLGRRIRPLRALGGSPIPDLDDDGEVEIYAE